MCFLPELQTRHLLLRGFRKADGPQVRHLAGAPEVAETTLNIPHPYQAGMAESWIASHRREYESGRGITLAVTLADSQQLVGAMGLILTRRFSRAELGYWIGKPYWGRGYATEAAAAMLRFGFQTLKLNKIHASHMTRNPASGRVMQKIGMVQEGLLRQHALKWDQFVDLAVYGLLAEDWLAEQSA